MAVWLDGLFGEHFALFVEAGDEGLDFDEGDDRLLAEADATIKEFLEGWPRWPNAERIERSLNFRGASAAGLQRNRESGQTDEFARIHAVKWLPDRGDNRVCRH